MPQPDRCPICGSARVESDWGPLRCLDCDWRKEIGEPTIDNSPETAQAALEAFARRRLAEGQGQ